jgi:hypothetical protein
MSGRTWANLDHFRPERPVASCLTRARREVRPRLSRVRRLESRPCVAPGQHVQEIIITCSFRPCAATS